MLQAQVHEQIVRNAKIDLPKLHEQVTMQEFPEIQADALLRTSPQEHSLQTIGEGTVAPTRGADSSNKGPRCDRRRCPNDRWLITTLPALLLCSGRPSQSLTMALLSLIITSSVMFSKHDLWPCRLMRLSKNMFVHFRNSSGLRALQALGWTHEVATAWSPERYTSTGHRNELFTLVEISLTCEAISWTSLLTTCWRSCGLGYESLADGRH